MSAITKHTEEINEKRMENMRNMDSKGNERDVVCVYVEPKINPREFTFFSIDRLKSYRTLRRVESTSRNPKRHW